jgi:hypothetical protein
MTAGIMTQVWNSPTATFDHIDDDLCGQLTGKGVCTEAMQTSHLTQLVETVDGKYDNLDVNSAFGGTPANVTFNHYTFAGSDDYFLQQTPGTAKNFAGDTAYALLNPWPLKLPGVSASVNESNLAAMWPSTGSGATFESTAWMCAAPSSPYPVTFPFGTQATVHDPMSGQQILADAERGPLPVTQGSSGPVVSSVVDQFELAKPNKCAAISSLPTDFAPTAATVAGQYAPSSSPITAAHAIQSAVTSAVGSGRFAFSAMDSSEADFFGLLPAELQNASGNFVAPTPSAVTAALNDATANSDGTVSPNFNNGGDSAAYPMPMVTYALVSTNPQPSEDQATQLKDMLTNFVNYSHSGGAGTGEPLPAGYVALPDNLYQQALSDISTDVVGPSGGGSGGGSGSTAGNSGSSSGGTSGGSNAPGGSGASGANGGSGASPASRAASGRSGTVGAGANGASSTGASSGNGNPLHSVGHLLSVAIGDNRFFVPALLLLALLCLLLGPLLYAYPSLRKSPAAAPDEDGGAGASEDPGAPASEESG